jgi:hypothetical protein
MTPKSVLSKRWPPIALALLAIVALLGPVWPGARLTASTGKVEVGRGEPPVWKTASAGDSLAAGDRVRTGADGRAELMHDGATLRVYPNSVLRLPEAEASRGVGLEKGSSLFDVLHQEREGFEVRTPEVVVSVKGTRFGVSVEDGGDAAVAVFRGLVGVHADAVGAAETLVHAGFAAHGQEHFELSWHGADDPWDGWSHGGALPGRVQESRHEAALRDVREVAMLASNDLPDAKDAPSGEDGKPEVDPGALPPASLDPDVEPGRNPVVGQLVRDVLTDVDEGRNVVQEEVLGGILDKATGGLLTINFVDGSGGSGSDRVELLDDVNTWVFEKDDLEEILEGDDSLPETLVTVLDQQGINNAALVNQLMALFRKK